MKREKIERLKEIYDNAFGVLRAEWDFGDFKKQNDSDEKEAEAIFSELLREAD